MEYFNVLCAKKMEHKLRYQEKLAMAVKNGT